MLASWLSAFHTQLPTLEEDEVGGSHVALYSEPRLAEGMPILAAAGAKGRTGQWLRLGGVRETWSPISALPLSRHEISGNLLSLI